MKNKLLTVLALDSLLREMDCYNSVEDDIVDEIEKKLFSLYGIGIDCSYPELMKTQDYMINDIKTYCNELIEELLRKGE